ncbi:hypothetical protein HK100_012522 [Physocladia obscura]|uniref:Zn(2)-C6 fungal-type domain-containing protein n=1 Tax=Physocladia obscura TaxID=109957 RepID=A0AAD5SZR1_9FUNG|nr:hypothetical protein HK100_012522 [Physocladia obscura]
MLKPCNRCAGMHKLCGKEYPACATCVRKDLPCVYRPDTDAPSYSNINQLYPAANHFHPYIPYRVNVPPNTQLRKYMATSEMPIEIFDDSSMDSKLYDMLECHLHESSFMFHSMCPINPKHFMLHFDSHPPAIRFMICAFTAHYKKLSPKIVQHHYDIARKYLAFMEAKPTLEYAQALFLEYQFTFARGQPAAGIGALIKAVALIEILQLVQDPDKLFYGETLSLSKKDERRRLYWLIYFCAKSVSLRTSKIKVPAISVSVKPHSQVFSYSNTIVKAAATFYMSHFLDIAELIANYARSPPASFQWLLSTENQTTIHNYLSKVANWQKTLPPHLHVTPETLQTHLSGGDTSAALNTIIVPSILICVAYRSVLYMTFINPILHSSTLLTDSTINFIVDAIETCLSESQRLENLFSRLVEMTVALEPGKKQLTSDFWRGMASIANGCFEGATVSWFMYCRTLPYYWHLYEERTNTHELEVRAAIVRRMEVFRKCLCLLETSQCGDEAKFNADVPANRACVVSPMLDCVVGMIAEMKSINIGTDKASRAYISGFTSAVPDFADGVFVNGYGISVMDSRCNSGSSSLTSFSVSNNVGARIEKDSVESLVLEMTVLSLDADDISDRPPVAVEEPWVYLGLLGMEVNQNLKWRAPYEEDWRRFWRQKWIK